MCKIRTFGRLSDISKILDIHYCYMTYLCFLNQIIILFLLLVIMSALSPCCQAEEEEKCNCNRVNVKRNPTREQLSNIEKRCKCVMGSTDSYEADKTMYVIEAHAAGRAYRPPQEVKRSTWNEFEQEKQKYRNPKIPGIFRSAGSLAFISMSVGLWSFLIKGTKLA